MASSSLIFRFVAILSVLTVINIVILGFSSRWNEQTFACSVDNVIVGVAKYLRNNGKHTLESELIEPCRKSTLRSETKDVLRYAIQDVITMCNRSRAKNARRKPLPSPIITLFTTWTSSDATKELVHNITMKNWLSLRPKVDIAVFTNDTSVIKIVKSFGIQTFPILKHGSGGAPVLPVMYQTVHKHFRSSLLFGYVNSDILFTDKLIKTLEVVLPSRDINKPVLMVGKRTNVLNVSANETTSYEDIEYIASTRGTLFHANAEDYFFTSRAFPWQDIAQVVVGRVAYDNWLVGHVICNLHIDVIELSESVIALHQTTSKGGNFEGFQNKDAHYNEGVFKKLGIVPVYEHGFTICAPEYTFVNICGDIELTTREKMWNKCSCDYPPNSTKTV